MEKPLLDKSMIKNLLLSFTDYNIKRESRNIIYVIVVKFGSSCHSKEATSNFAYV